MDKIEYTKMFKMEDKHFWFIGKRYFVDSILLKYKSQIHNILDLGSGTGGMTKHMQKYGSVAGIENYDYAIKLAKSKGLSIKKGDLNKFKVKDNSFDLVTIFDVLYHQNINNEGEIVRRSYKALKKGGLLLITDSALEILTSKHDVVTQGKRRYSLNQMRQIIENQNFKIIKASYIYFFIFPIVFLKRFVLDKIVGKDSSDVKPVSYFLNKLLLSIIKIESIFLEYTSFPIGSSVILLATKK